MEEFFIKHFPFSSLAKNLKKNLKCDPQIILGFFDPDPVLLAKQGEGGAEQRIKKSQNDLRIKLQNFVFYNLDQ